MDREAKSYAGLGQETLIELSDTLNVHVGRSYREDIRGCESQGNAKKARLE